jgi:hypothetical protein
MEAVVLRHFLTLFTKEYKALCIKEAQTLWPDCRDEVNADVTI